MSTRALTELLHGQGSHADPLACIEDLSCELAGQHVQGFPHSIAGLIFHMNYWMDYELRRIRGQKPRHPEHNSESFPAKPQLDPQEWDELRKRFADLLSAITALANSSPDAMQRQLESVHEGDKKVAGTLEGVITQMIAHNSYHTGQIAMMRRMLNAWPPRAGGDTW
jgi:uncharacterized damage-inducible protein DinB